MGSLEVIHHLSILLFCCRNNNEYLVLKSSFEGPVKVDSSKNFCRFFSDLIHVWQGFCPRKLNVMIALQYSYNNLAPRVSVTASLGAQGKKTVPHEGLCCLQTAVVPPLCFVEGLLPRLYSGLSHQSHSLLTPRVPPRRS